jgi:hypothetical protein
MLHALTTEQAAAALKRKLDEATAVLPIHEDGIYFNLPKDEYHRDPALGSHDVLKLAYSPADYWWSSHMNPRRPPDSSTEYQARGTAVHVLVLEGEAAFGARYMRGPDQDGMTASQKAQSTRAANERAVELGKECLRAVDYDRVAVAGAMIKLNPRLSSAFSGGASEVSVFWTDEVEGLDHAFRKKARFDYLKARGIGDLKSVANQHEVPFPRACVNAITNYSYHVQAKHYLDARARLPGLIREDAVHGIAVARAPAADLEKLMRDVLDAGRWAWQWVFWQSERAPITHSRVLSPGNPMLEMAASVITRGEQNFVEYLRLYGETQWVEITEPTELLVEEMPSYFGRDY